jgi:hypothetical protein
VPSPRGQRLSTAGGRLLADGGAALPAWPILGLLCLASAITMVALGSRLTFFNDDWFFLLGRPGFTFNSLFAPYNGHLNLIPVLTWKTLVELFGLDSQVPFRIALAALNSALAVLVFVFVRERAGQLLGLVAAALLLFLGPGWEALIFLSPSVLVGSLTTGVAALLVLERDTPRRNLLACGLLVVSILTSNLGLAFVVAGVVAVAVRRRPSQAWLPAVPALLFCVWYLVKGREAHETDITLGNIARLPGYVLDSISSGLASLAGLTQVGGGDYDPLAWGRPLLALALVATVLWFRRGGRPSPFALVIAAAALTFWLLAGADFTPPGDEPTASRYQLVSAVFLILFAAELFRPVRLSPPALAAIAALALVAIGSNLAVLKDGYNLLRHQSQISKADLGALDIARGHIRSDFVLGEDEAGTPFLAGVTAGAYFRERDEHGSPAYSPAQIAAAEPDVRQPADSVLVSAYRLRLDRVPGAPRARGPGCRRLAPGFEAGPVSTLLRPGGARISNSGAGPAKISVRRFAPRNLPIELGRLAAGYSALLAVPRDRIRLPWHLSAGGSAIEVCPIG